MTDKERTEAWLNLPAEMRRELADLCRSHSISHNTRLRIEKIFGRENVNPEKKANETAATLYDHSQNVLG